MKIEWEMSLVIWGMAKASPHKYASKLKRCADMLMKIKIFFDSPAIQRESASIMCLVDGKGKYDEKFTSTCL